MHFKGSLFHLSHLAYFLWEEVASPRLPLEIICLLKVLGLQNFYCQFHFFLVFTNRQNHLQHKQNLPFYKDEIHQQTYLVQEWKIIPHHLSKNSWLIIKFGPYRDNSWNIAQLLSLICQRLVQFHICIQLLPMYPMDWIQLSRRLFFGEVGENLLMEELFLQIFILNTLYSFF